MNLAKYIRVALAVPLNSYFDYAIPENIDAERMSGIRPGTRVLVPFGKKKQVGCIVKLLYETDIAPEKIRELIQVLDTDTLFSTADLSLMEWASRYYHHPVGEVIISTLPSILRSMKNKREEEAVKVYCISVEGRDSLATGQPQKRAPKQHDLLTFLCDHSSIDVTKNTLNTEIAWPWRPAMQALVKKGWVDITEKSSKAPLSEENYSLIKDSALQLNRLQQNAVDNVIAKGDGFSVFLLEGVTGSGKTEVYLQLIQRQLAKKKQVLVLLPEIALTPQLEKRFIQRFGSVVACYHSGLTERQRCNAWLGFQSGTIGVVLGTRSATFIPMRAPGIIILDEEHDASFRQQEGFRFHARDVSVARGKKLNIPVLLGTATPSLESLHNALTGRYTHLHLPERAGAALPPVMKVIDIRNQVLQSGLSPQLVQATKQCLAKSEQVILFLNRRGYAPALICHGCGAIVNCHRCDASMVLHRQGQDSLHCHHCGFSMAKPEHCPECHSSDLRLLGQGTQKLEEAMSSLFPSNKVIRLDRDNMAKAGALGAALDIINQGEPCIILGTQMLAKGHHFPNVTLVGIVDADGGLFSTDFRAPERLAQLIVQVSGRAGRELKKGVVLIQTHQPEHPLLVTLLNQGYAAFARQALEERKIAKLPPYSFHALIKASAHESDLPMDFLQHVAREISPLGSDDVTVLGPIPCTIQRLSGRYRYQLLIQSTVRSKLHAFLSAAIPLISDSKLSRRVRWSVDIDPLDFG